MRLTRSPAILCLLALVVALPAAAATREEERVADSTDVLDQLLRIPEQAIPEQFFPKDDPREGVKPLLWSHMMFVHAAKELGYIENELF